MGEAMTLIAFYFAVISLASSLFFNQVEAWHGPVRSFETSLKELKEVDEWRRADEQRKPIEAAAPNLFAALVGLLVAGLTVLAFLVPMPNEPPFNPLLFLRLPLVFVVILFGGWALRAYSTDTAASGGRRRVSQMGCKVDTRSLAVGNAPSAPYQKPPQPV